MRLARSFLSSSFGGSIGFGDAGCRIVRRLRCLRNARTHRVSAPILAALAANAAMLATLAAVARLAHLALVKQPSLRLPASGVRRRTRCQRASRKRGNSPTADGMHDLDAIAR